MKRFSVIFWMLVLTALSSQAQVFIGCRTDSGWAETPMLRTTFHVDAGDLTETAFRSCYYGLVVTSLGYHEVYVNGTKVGDYVMQPAVSQLDKRALWVEYDITPYLHEGDNELMLWIGQGWGRIYGTPAAVQATVRKSVSDGECGLIYEILKTDSTWDASASPYSYTGNWQPMQFGGERYDARVKESWRPASVYDAEGYQPGSHHRSSRATASSDFCQPQSVDTLPDGTLLFDFGRVVTGWFQLDCLPIPEGDSITMEYLDHLDAKPPHTETDIYVSDGSGDDDIHFTNRFHTHSFRYVRVKGASVVSARALQISAVDPAGGATFECSDPRLNAIHDMVKYTLSCLTFSGYMVDCPHIERMGYGGDGNSSTNTLQTLWDVRDVYANWMQAWHDALDSTGDLPYVAPAFRTGGGPYWQGFIVKAPWRTYLNYGDPTLIYRHYNDMCRWMDYIERHSVDGILQPWPDTERHGWFLGDWAVPDGVDKGGESVLHASSCFIAECLADMERMARMTGPSDDASVFAAWRKARCRRHPPPFLPPRDAHLRQRHTARYGLRPADGRTARQRHRRRREGAINQRHPRPLPRPRGLRPHGHPRLHRMVHPRKAGRPHGHPAAPARLPRLPVYDRPRRHHHLGVVGLRPSRQGGPQPRAQLLQRHRHLVLPGPRRHPPRPRSAWLQAFLHRPAAVRRELNGCGAPSLHNTATYGWKSTATR